MFKNIKISRPVLLFVLLLWVLPVAGQQQNIDSLKMLLETAEEKQRYEILLGLSSQHLHLSQYREAINYAKDGLDYGQSSGNHDKDAKLHRIIGDAYSKQGNFRKAVAAYEDELAVLRRTANKDVVMDALFKIGRTYKKWNRRRSAIDYFMESLQLAKELNLKFMILQNYQALHEVYRDLNDQENTIKYYNLYFDLYIAIQDSSLIENKTQQINELQDQYEEQQQEERRLMQRSIDSVLIVSEHEIEVLKQAARNREKEIELLRRETELKERELRVNKDLLEIRNRQVEQQRITTYIFIGISLLVLMFLLTLLWLYNQKRKVNKLLEKKNNQIIDSINYAKRIQDSILIPEEEIRMHLPNSFVFYEPKDIVSGDFYWFTIHNDLLIVAAVDCTGHGVPGAFMSMIGNTLLSEIVDEKGITQPNRILQELHTGIYSALKQDKKDSQDGMDMALCTIDLKNRKLAYAGAKNHLFMIRNGEFEMVKADFYSIGGTPLRKYVKDARIIQFNTKTIDIEENMSIYLMSDGYMDQFGGTKNTKFNRDRFKELILTNKDLEMKQQKEIIAQTFHQWKGDYRQVDDVLIFGIKFTKPMLIGASK